MWNKPQTQPEVPSYSPSPSQGSSPSSSSQSSFGAAPSSRPSAPAARNLACLGASLEIKGKISGEEDLQVDGKVEGPIALSGQRLTAREVVVYGKLTGNLRASDRVEIKKDGSVIGDITTSRISIEDGAYFKGRIEIDRPKHQSASELDSDSVPVGAEAN
jgi:cytoskeletal protein CcmA (bactofilin family)